VHFREPARTLARPVWKLRVPDGRVVVCGGSNDEHLLTMAAGKRPEPPGHRFRRTRPAQQIPPWLHNWCVADPDFFPGHQRE
jgi:hypothetical protein